MFLSNILEKLNKKANYYQINPLIFIGLYIFSFLPFYLGIYLILVGLGIRVDSIIDLATKKDFQIDFSSSFVVWGVLINRLAWALPYFYIEFFGKNLKWYYHILIWLWVGISVINFIFS
ncbi:MAG: hypothetical protein US36_C0006G0003 [Candidatus Wolfebacteria bacterium GW2011_GWC1_37_10]|uniref:Uncharacterized protein n=1 Tax=Candidatus Wolfebacteria bacterium GW2011_GWC1_37_10 TaxID=1619010 RepID=A0A0G0IFK3_9BACT|nr:MAG: hypothetical protein US36_C0006G0003 [Candidatus Wolfebacteria bacterium GW2011_GWC1_37_10]